MRFASPAVFRPLRYRQYRAFWLGNLCTHFATWMQVVAAAWLMISLSPRSDLVAMIQTATTLPAIISSVAGGIFADLWNRRIVLLYGQVIMLTGTAMLAILNGFENITPWLLLAFTFVVGAGTHMNLPANQTTAGELVPYEEIPRAIALNAIGYNLARSIGPSLGGVLVALYGVTTTFAVSASLYVVLFIVLLGWKQTAKRDELPREPLWPAIGAGFRYLRHAPEAVAGMVRCTVFTIAASAIWALLPLLAEQQLAGSSMFYGFLLGCLSVGAVAGALLFDRLKQKLSSEMLVSVGGGLLSIAILCLALTTYLPVVIAALFVVGIVWVANLTVLNVTVQLSAAEWVRTRLLSLYYAALAGGLALGSWFWGMLTQHYGLETALIDAGLFSIGSMVLSPFFRIPGQLPNDLIPISHSLAVELPPDIEPGVHAVMVNVEYRIDRARMADFQKAMEHLRVIRLRDGAANWSLYQSAADASLWIETFAVASWTEYLRRRRRLTMRDWPAIEAVRQFHTGPDKPLVTRFIRRRW